MALFKRGDEMILENHPKAEEVAKLKEELSLKWNSVKDLSTDQRGNLDESLQAKQVFSLLRLIDSVFLIIFIKLWYRYG